MDPSEFLFDIEAYKRQSEIEDRYIINRFFRKKQNQIKEEYTPRAARNEKKEKAYLRQHTALQVTIQCFNTDRELVRVYLMNFGFDLFLVLLWNR
jgi:hypothetical protein